MASSSTTCPAGTTRRRTNSPRLLRVGSPSPRTFSHGTSPSRPSTSSHTPRAARNPRGLPRVQRGRSPWTRTPRTRRTCSPCSRGTTSTRPKPWTWSWLPARGTGATNTSPGWLEGELPSEQCEARLIARMAKSFALIDGELYKRRIRHLAAMRAHPPGARAPPGYTRGCVRPPRRTPHPRGQCVPPVVLLAHRSR
jgi:hypothetical protein